MQKFREITKERLEQMKKYRDVLIADVRSPEYFSSSAITDSVNLYTTRNFINSLHHIDNKKQPIVIVSHDIDDEDLKTDANYAELLGFENVYVSDFASLRDD